MTDPKIDRVEIEKKDPSQVEAVDQTEVVEIKIPSDVEGDIEKSANVSETLRLKIQKNINDKQTEASELEPDPSSGGVAPRPVKTKSSKTDNDIVEKVKMVYEVLEDRAQNSAVMTLDEVCDMTGIPKADVSAFMLRLNRMARENSKRVKKLKRKIGTCYVLA